MTSFLRPNTRYLNALRFLTERKMTASGPMKLDAIRNASKHFSDPFTKFKCIHVAGTNGKGSVSYKIAAALTSMGYTTGLTVSPHISCLRERIQIDDSLISENDFSDELDLIISSYPNHSELSFFEILTLCSLNYFARKQVDYAVLEVGCGGLLDATNIITEPELSVITNIGLDHTAILGDTLESITMHKAGIIKKGCNVVIGPNVNEQLIREYMTTLTSMNSDFETAKNSEFQQTLTTDSECDHLLHVVDDFTIRKQGFDDFNEINHWNECIAAKSINVLFGQKVVSNSNPVQEAIKRRPPCRFEKVSYFDEDTECIVECIMDCAHNLDAFELLFRSLSLMSDIGEVDIRIVIGMSKGKNADLCLSVCDENEFVKYIHFVSVSEENHRALTVDELRSCYHGKKEKIVEYEGDGDEQNAVDVMVYALKKCARNNAMNTVKGIGLTEGNRKQMVLICGSVYIMSAARRALKCDHPVDPVNFTSVEFGNRSI